MKKTVLLVVLAALAAGCASVKEQKCAEGRYDFLTKKFNMWNIIPPSIGFEETTIKDIIEFHKRTGIDTVLYSMPLNPRRSDQYQYLEEMIQSYRKVKAGLAGHPIKLGILIQAILGHVTNPTVVIDGWTRTYTSTKQASRFCALNPILPNTSAPSVPKLPLKSPSLSSVTMISVPTTADVNVSANCTSRNTTAASTATSKPPKSIVRRS